jgi:hypothetical protein
MTETFSSLFSQITTVIMIMAVTLSRNQENMLRIFLEYKRWIYFSRLRQCQPREEYKDLKTGFWSALHEHAFQYTRFYSSISKSTLIPEKQRIQILGS